MLKGLYLTLLVGPAVPQPVPLPVLDSLVSAQVTTSTGDRSGFQLQFTYGKASAIGAGLLPAGYFDPGVRVILMATVNGIPNVLVDGLVTRQDVSPSNTPGGSTLTVTGEDIAVAMDLVDLTGQLKYPALRPSDRVLTILGRYAAFGVVPKVVPSPLEEPPNPTETTFGHEGTDYAYAKRLADEVGYTFYIEPGPAPGLSTAYWGPEIRLGVPQPALNINMDAETNLESISFHYNGLQGRNEIALVQQAQTRVPIPIPVPDINLVSPPLAVRPAVKLRTAQVRETANLSPIQAMAKMLGSAKDAAEAIGASGSLDVLRYGRILKARALVGVRGAGIAYDGLYYVNSVTHDIRAGAYKQQFSLSRNGLVPIAPVVVP
ncbi:MAG TPA: hypothetical protein VGE01_09680 [Fimbriimonas sp.]